MKLPLVKVSDFVFLCKGGIFSLERSSWGGGRIFTVISSKTTDLEIVHCTKCVLTDSLRIF